ncbi:MAG: flagellar protein FlgN [Planctomycetota bacterium]|jgi:hypothetical protein
MNKSIESSRFHDLRELLARLEELHLELVSLIRAKTDAMKRNDLDAMRDLVAREQTLARTIHEREGLRGQLMDVIGGQMGWPRQTARALSLSQLAARVPDAQRDVLLSVGRSLREAVSRVARVNRIAGAVARQISNHLEWVFASVKPQQAAPAGYSGSGGLVTRSETVLLDAVG